MVNPQAVRRWVMTGSVAAITVSGALYGAGLKADQEKKQLRKRVEETPIEDKIAMLEASRAELVNKKNELQRKFEMSKQRRRDEEAGITPSPKGR